MKEKTKIICCTLLALIAISTITPIISKNMPTIKAEQSSGDEGRLARGTTQHPWPTFHHDMERTGSTDSFVPTSNTLAWFYDIGGTITGSPAVDEGIVVIGSFNGKVFALNATTGEPIWNFTTGDVVESSPTIYEGKVYIGSDDDHLYCLNLTTGEQIWNYTTGGDVKSCPAVYQGMVYFGSMDNHTYCLNATTGEQIWNFTTGGGIEGSPAIYAGKVYIGSLDHKLYCLDATTGNHVWNFTTVGEGEIRATPLIYQGRVIIGSDDGTLYALDASTGAMVGGYTFAYPIKSTPAIREASIIISVPDGRVYCMSSDAKTVIWSSDIMVTYSSPAVAGGYIYVGSENGNIYCLSADNGSVIWSYPTGGPIRSSPAVADGKVFVGSGDGKIYAIGGRDVAISWVDVSARQAEVGDTIEIAVRVKNQGSETETFDVTVYYDGTAIDTQTVSGLAPGEEQLLMFTWDTSAVSAGNYTISARASEVPNEADTTNNEYVFGEVSLILIKEPSSITISVSPTSIVYGENVTITGSISPVKSGVPVTIWYRMQDGNWTRLADVSTDSNSEFSYVWTPDAAQEYWFKASWEGDEENLGAESDEAHLEVLRANSTIIVSLSSTEIEEESNITISGAISPPLENMNVTIMYRKVGGNWTVLAVVLTEEDGSFSYVWSPPERGNYLVKASWEGSQNYLGAETEPKSFKVVRKISPIPGLNLPAMMLLGTMAVIAVAISVIVVAILRFTSEE